MSVLHVRQIRAKIESAFTGKIDLADTRAEGPERETAFLTRALAAHALTLMAHVDNDQAAHCVTDGSGDNGIDALLFDEEDHCFYVVQSKWFLDGNGSPAVGDVLKTLEGFRDLLDGAFQKFNAKVQAHRSEILAAINDATTRFVLCFAYTGAQGLSAEAMGRINETLRDLNDTSELVTLKVLAQKELHDAIAGTADGAPINIEVMLSEWGLLKNPFSAVYGQVSAADVAGWLDASQQLFAKNLRKIITDSNINKQLTETLRQAPEHFWYFNNGITALCQKFKKKPLGGDDRGNAVFEVEGVSIVNGAQTAGSIAAAHRTDPTAVAKARVNVRFISLENCPDNFATDVTRATNTQNRIENRDFAALDPEQDRLRRELHLDGRGYVYKTGDSPTSTTTGCTIDEATVALACAWNDVALSVIAKSQVGKLWEDINKPPYKLLFNAGLTSQKLWNAVETLRAVEDALRSLQASAEGKAKTAAVHGNRFLAHQVMKRLPRIVDDPEFRITEAKSRIDEILPGLLRQSVDLIATRFPTSYLQSLFKNSTKCKALDVELQHSVPP